MARIHEIVVDCRRLASLARFWAIALNGYDIAPYDEAELQRLRSVGVDDRDDDPTVRVQASDGCPSLFFQRVPDLTTSGFQKLNLDRRRPEAEDSGLLALLPGCAVV